MCALPAEWGVERKSCQHMPGAWREGLEGDPETLCDFYLFLKLKIMLKEGKFNDITMIQAKLLSALTKFQTTVSTKCFIQWHEHWACSVSPKDSAMKAHH
jgi:hypothetical protein